MQTGSPAFILERIPHTKLKPNASSVLARLDDERRVQLHAWLKNSMAYRQIVEKMRIEWNVKTSPRALSLYYRKYVANEIIEQRQRTAGVTAELNKEISRTPADYARAICDAVGRKSVELTNTLEVHPKVVRIWIDMWCKTQEQEIRKRALRIKERRIRLLERQAEELRETASNSKLTDAEKAEGIWRILNPSLDEPDKAQTNSNGFADGKKRAPLD